MNTATASLNASLGYAKCAEAACFHCGLAVPQQQTITAQIDGARREFCCIGCQSVCAAIYEAGLQGFYQRTPQGILLAPPPTPPGNLTLYDLDDIQGEFVNELGETRSLYLLIEGMHCAACVWLIEKSMATLPGIVQASINLTGKRLSVRWDNRQIKLSEIIRRLGEIGYNAVPYDPEAVAGVLKKQNRALLLRLIFAGFATANIMLVAIALYSGADQGEFRQLFHWVGLALATPTLFYSGGHFFRGAWTGIKQLHLTMDVPIVIGTSLTYLYSTYVTLAKPVTGEVYFDTVINLIFVILIGRYLEGSFKQQAMLSTQRLMDLQPRVATVMRNGQEQVVPVRAVQIGEIVLIKPGANIPVDGVVCEGSSAVDEAMLSGESLPVAKQVDSNVSAGTVNGSGMLLVRTACALNDTALARIIRLVEEAQSSKAPIQRIADRIVPWFIFVTLLLAAATFVGWLPVNLETALMAATSVLIITCPCALGMATPLSIAVASGLGARRGILIKNGETLETLSGVTHFVFDKTGTLTQGRMQVHQITVLPHFKAQEMLRQVAALERYAEHGVAQAILKEAEVRGITRAEAQDFSYAPGYGVRGTVDGVEVLAGTAAWLVRNGISINVELQRQVAELEQRAMTCVHLAVGHEQVGYIALADELRPDAKVLIENLRAMGMRLTLLSGDRKAVAESVAAQLGGMDVIAEVLPQDKDQVIQSLQQRGEKVAMVGDGINDAPALIRADVGIAVGSGTDVSVESASIVLTGSELDKVRQAMLLSRRTLHTIRQNIILSLTYNAVMVPLAMMGLVTPLVAAIAMPVSSLLVIGNAARLRNILERNS
ncbi:MAG: heavy metal translocating P-type ATPase [Gallionellaceae bacterium]|nr:heavy metal translocating P-type ATPase [Gallionellaceae bacterium]